MTASEKISKNSGNNSEEEDMEELHIQIGDYSTIAKYREFSSGKKGFGAYGIIKVNGQPFRLSLNLIEF